MAGNIAHRGLRRILYAEDDPDIQHIAQFALERVGGFEVAICSSGLDTLRRAEGFAPDLILLDLMLPGMGGQELYCNLRVVPELATTPVVFVTARAYGRELQDCIAMGALGVVTKPFDPMMLAEQLGQLWARHQEALGLTAAIEGHPSRPAI